MKKMRNIFAMLVAMFMVFGMSTNVFAATITVERDSTYGGEVTDDGRIYTYRQIFRATLTGANTSTGGEYDADGTPGTVEASLEKGYSYFLNSTDTTQINQLGTWVAATGDVAAHWQRASGNLWFDITPSADGTQYVVSWVSGVGTDADTAQAAAKWLSTNYTALTSAALTFANGKWTATNLEDGYYLISSDTGNNLVAATGDINIKEKNSYPGIDKTQADEDNQTQVNDSKNVAVGDVLTYEAKVDIPVTAKVGEVLKVVDTPSRGLTYNGDVTVKTNLGNATVAFGTAAGQAWNATVTVTEASKGKSVVFSYTMTVNANAIDDANRTNTFDLAYEDNYTATPDTVSFTTYFTGIEKVDGENTNVKLKDVEFTLKEGDAEFKVKKGDDGVYIPDASGTATVVTNAQGLIKIRGLDKDKTYTLTETKTKDGYNLLNAPTTLKLYEDKGDAFSTTTSFDQIHNNKGSVLPSTGGIGTTIFYIVGGVMVAGAAIFLLTKRRMSGAAE